MLNLSLEVHTNITNLREDVACWDYDQEDAPEAKGTENIVC